MENFEASQYRKNLAEEIKQEPDKNKKREVLEQAKGTEEYQTARTETIVARREKIEEQQSVVEQRETEPNLEKPLKNLWEQVTGIYPYKGEIPDGFKSGERYSYRGKENPPQNIIDIECVENQKQAIEKIDQELKRLFPNSGPFVEKFLESANVTVEGFDHRQALLDIGEKSGIGRDYFRDRVLQTHYTGPKTQQGETAYFMAAFLNGGPIPSEGIDEKIREILKGKKILIIGDDFGTISEALNVLGAEATGIEYSSISVKIAHSGALAEDGKPQNQVLQGDAWDIGNPNSTLYKQLQERGPFDMIYSYAVFNGGSGFPESKKRWGIGKENFSLGLDQLLSDDGMQFHAGCEEQDVYLERLFRLKYVDGQNGYREAVKKLDDPELSEALDEVVTELSNNYNFHGGRYDMPSRIDNSALVRGRLTTHILPQVKKIKTALGERTKVL